MLQFIRSLKPTRLGHMDLCIDEVLLLCVSRVECPGGFPKRGDPYYSTLNSRILIKRTPHYSTPHFRKVPPEYSASEAFGCRRIRALRSPRLIPLLGSRGEKLKLGLRT